MDPATVETDDIRFMRLAIEQARLGDQTPGAGEVGCVIVSDGEVVAEGHNEADLRHDPTAHAEMLAITQAEAAIGDWRLNDCDLYVTKEPCPMCAGAIVHARIRRVIFGCADERGGAAGSVINLLQMPTLNHRCEITAGVLHNECAALLQSFFRARRGP